MILPNGNSKKYIKTIMGVYILYTIIAPAIRLITGSDLKINYSDYEKYFGNMETSSKVEGIKIEDTYKTEIGKQMKTDTEKMGYEVTSLKFDLDTENWIIDNVNMYVKKSVKEKSKENRIDIEIENIEVGDKKTENSLNSDEINQIKQMISENYGVDTKKITINLM